MTHTRHALALITVLSLVSAPMAGNSASVTRGKPVKPGEIAAAGMDAGTPDQQFAQPVEGDTDWPSYNRRLDGNRYSDLSDINTETVGRLREVCRVKVGGAGPFSAGPLLVNGALYTTTSRSTLAINPQTCEIIWKARYDPDETEVFVHNRGVTYIDGLVVRGTGDARLVAYDARTGKEVWRKAVGDPKVGEFVSAAPIAWEGRIFAGLAGGDWGIQGRMMALDAKTGEKLWSFNTIPHPGEFGNETWPGDTWKRGGGGTWSSYTLDAETGELFVPVANPSPDLDAKSRKGDNLYSNSVLVLDARTGKRLWHYQTRPNDNHDYGVAPPAVLLSMKNGRNIVAQGSKDGFVYTLDRKTRKLRYRTPVTTIFNHMADATPEGVKICPGLTGGMEYNGPGYDAPNHALVTAAVDWCSIIIEGPETHVPGQIYLGGKFRQDGTGSGWIMSIDADTGKVRWKFHAKAPTLSGVVATAGGVTFAGDMGGSLYVLRSADGSLLRQIETGGAVAGGLITYRSGGTQYLAVNSGNISRSTWPQAAPGLPTLIIYALGDGTEPAAASAAPASPASAALSPPDVARGKATFGQVCVSCHGAKGEGQTGPALSGLAARYTFEGAVAFLKKPTGAMPPVYPGLLSEQAVHDVAAYVRTLP